MLRVGARPLPRRIVFGFGTSLALGSALGVAAWLSDELGYPWGALVPANAIGAWLGLAFYLGTTARTVPTGAVRGLVGLLAAVVAYYILIATFGAGLRAIGASHAATIWGAVALLAGPVMGAAGGVWRHRRGWPRAAALALIAAALVAEGIVFAGSLRFDAGGWLLWAEAALGLAMPALLLHGDERLRGYAMTALLALAGALALGPVTAILRGLADRF